MRFLDRPIPFGAELEVRDDDSRHSWSTTCEKGAPVLKAYIDEALELLAYHDYSISLTEKIADRYYLDFDSILVIFLFFYQSLGDSVDFAGLF